MEFPAKHLVFLNSITPNSQHWLLENIAFTHNYGMWNETVLIECVWYTDARPIRTNVLKVQQKIDTYLSYRKYVVSSIQWTIRLQLHSNIIA